MRSFSLLFILFVFPSLTYSWDGYDYDKGSYIEIDKGNLVRPGEEIEIYDYDTGTYKNVEVESIHGTGNGAEVEIYDSESGEYRTFEME